MISNKRMVLIDQTTGKATTPTMKKKRRKKKMKMKTQTTTITFSHQQNPLQK